MKIYGHRIPIGEARNGEDGKKLDGAKSGEKIMKWNTLCFRIWLRKMFRSRKTEGTC